MIDTSKCINCNLCRNACPQIEMLEGLRPFTCYAAWSNDDQIRQTSASGGIATELYAHFADAGGYYTGVSVNPDFTVSYKLFNGKENYRFFQNSKYVFSDTSDVFNKISEQAKRGAQVLFIGLPCHVAALRKYMMAKRIEDRNVFYVDIICHGTSPASYLVYHIRSIEKRIRKNATDVYFRDPEEGTYTFTFSLKNNGKTLYKQCVHRNDAYQIGYHYGIIYRDNCYNCSFACPERQGDCTIGDFSGLGKMSPCEFNGINVSCLLVNTEKGKNLIEQLSNENRITLVERPVEEALLYEKQLSHPTIIPKERKRFIELYERTHDFDYSLLKAARVIVLKNELNRIFPIKKIIRIVKLSVPKRAREIISKKRKV